MTDKASEKLFIQPGEHLFRLIENAQIQTMKSLPYRYVRLTVKFSPLDTRDVILGRVQATLIAIKEDWDIAGDEEDLVALLFIGRGCYVKHKIKEYPSMQTIGEEPYTELHSDFTFVRLAP